VDRTIDAMKELFKGGCSSLGDTSGCNK